MVAARTGTWFNSTKKNRMADGEAFAGRTSATTFSPLAACTRAQAMSFLYRAFA